MSLPRMLHMKATAAEWGISQPKNPGENDRKRSLPSVATELNARLKLICNTAASAKEARTEMQEQIKLFARYGAANPKAERLVQDRITEAFLRKR